ncbi:ROK family transcriptional regulator [Litorihabitans aurantiacus]|uniref:Sugar kinase n=1 Tax=Litorihabitans aurantiacus TaxID=1930061 RepID=A0AA37XGM7_9MICO|nr:ROK family transcriptional regulator [Litorihabitans aurantiacus]GMA32971.1 sugar kinase [Litorihabitans aurantiacus]
MTTDTTERLRIVTRSAGAGELFQLLRDGRPRTRTELATLTGHARSTITSRLEALLASGLIAPVGEASSTGGRPSTSFAFNPTSRVVLAVDLGATHARLGVTDLAGEVLASSEDRLDIADGPERVLAWVAETGRRLIAEAGRDVADLMCVGAGLPGPVEHSTGQPINPPIMPGWDGVDVPGMLTAHLGVPAFVDNDVNLMALGEHRHAWPDVADLLVVKVATGIGAGLILDGSLRRGAQGAAGDIGHINPDNELTTPCRCGNTGCLEAVAGGGALAAELREQGVEAETSTDVVALARAGNLPARHAVRSAGRLIGTVLASCVSMVNPSLIVIGGVLSESGDHLIAGIREVVYQRSLPLATQHLRIVTSRTGASAGILGASMLAVDEMLSVDAVDALAG